MYRTRYHTSLRPFFQYFTFIRTSGYLRAAAQLLTDAEEREIERVLCENPHAGDTVARAGGVAKLRVKLPGAGKSGGVRLIYFHRGSVGRIYLLRVRKGRTRVDLRGRKKRTQQAHCPVTGGTMTARKKKTTLGQHLIAGLREAVADERGEPTGVETRKVLTARFADVDGVPTYSPVRIVHLRESLEVSQPVFASVLNVIADTVRSWEQA